MNEEEAVGVICIGHICFRADMFNKEQMGIVKDLCSSSYNRGLFDEAKKHKYYIKFKKIFSKK